MKRVIFLVDMNAFFISCEMSRDISLVDKPAAVAGSPENRTGIILAANYKARKYGIKTAMVLFEAMRLCPNLVLVPPDHNYYIKKSNEVMKLLSTFTPIMEENSIDEAWLDMTGCEKMFGTPLEAAQKIMDNINNELGLWCSIGISENKFLSKMAADMKKPMGITELWVKDIEKKLWPLKVGLMYGIGKKTTKKLNDIGILTIGDIANINEDIITRIFGKSGHHIVKLANGKDDEAVKPHLNNEMKSIGKSTTLSEDIIDIEIAKDIILRLSEEIGQSARKHNKKGSTVTITIKYSDFKVITRQRTVSRTYLTKDIYIEGVELLKKNWDINKPVRLIGITLSGFEDEDKTKQISIFQLLDSDRTNKKEEKLEKTMDTIKNRFGNDKIKRGTLLKMDRKYDILIKKKTEE